MAQTKSSHWRRSDSKLKTKVSQVPQSEKLVFWRSSEMTISSGAFLSLYTRLDCILARLLDIVHADQKLYLVFEFLDVDLKRYIEQGNQSRKPITPQIVKVGYSARHLSFHSPSFSNPILSILSCLSISYAQGFGGFGHIFSRLFTRSTRGVQALPSERQRPNGAGSAIWYIGPGSERVSPIPFSPSMNFISFSSCTVAFDVTWCCHRQVTFRIEPAWLVVPY